MEKRRWRGGVEGRRWRGGDGEGAEMRSGGGEGGGGDRGGSQLISAQWWILTVFRQQY